REVDVAESEVLATLCGAARGEHHLQTLRVDVGDPLVDRVGAPRRPGALDRPVRCRAGRRTGDHQHGNHHDNDGPCTTQTLPHDPPPLWRASRRAVTKSRKTTTSSTHAAP